MWLVATVLNSTETGKDVDTDSRDKDLLRLSHTVPMELMKALDSSTTSPELDEAMPWPTEWNGLWGHVGPSHG